MYGVDTKNRPMFWFVWVKKLIFKIMSKIFPAPITPSNHNLSTKPKVSLHRSMKALCSNIIVFVRRLWFEGVIGAGKWTLSKAMQSDGIEPTCFGCTTKQYEQNQMGHWICYLYIEHIEQYDAIHSITYYTPFVQCKVKASGLHTMSINRGHLFPSPIYRGQVHKKLITYMLSILITVP